MFFVHWFGLAILCMLENVIMLKLSSSFFFCLNLVFCGGFDLSKLDANWLRRVFLGCTI